MEEDSAGEAREEADLVGEEGWVVVARVEEVAGWAVDWGEEEGGCTCMHSLRPRQSHTGQTQRCRMSHSSHWPRRSSIPGSTCSRTASDIPGIPGR